MGGWILRAWERGGYWRACVYAPSQSDVLSRQCIHRIWYIYRCIGNLHMQRYLLEVWADLCASSQVTGWLTNSGGKVMVSCLSNRWATIVLKRSRKLISAPSSSKQTILQSRSNVLDEPCCQTTLVKTNRLRCMSMSACLFGPSLAQSEPECARGNWSASLHACVRYVRTRPLIIVEHTPHWI